MTITDSITHRIHAKRRGWVFTPKDFFDLGSRAAVDKVLSRLVTNGTIRRIHRGVYDFPKKHKLLGTLSPDIDSLAQAVATTGDTVFPSGAMAANMLGLSTQVPAKAAYLTNGHSRIKQVGGRTITLKHARVSLLDNVPLSVNLTIQALSHLGKNGIDNDTIQSLTKKLPDTDKKHLARVIHQLPGWMVGIMHRIIDHGQFLNTPR